MASLLCRLAAAIKARATPTRGICTGLRMNGFIRRLTNCSWPTVTAPSFSDPGPQQFSIVHAIRVANDGTVYVADREYRRVQMFTKDGKFLKQLVRSSVPFARDLALSPDTNQQFLYVGGGNGIFIVDRKTLEIVGNIAPAGIIWPGHEISTESKANLDIAQTTSGLQKLTFKGMAYKN